MQSDSIWIGLNSIASKKICLRAHPIGWFSVRFAGRSDDDGGHLSEPVAQFQPNRKLDQLIGSNHSKLNCGGGGGRRIDHNSTQFNTIQLFFCFWSWLASPEHDGKWPPTAMKPNPQKSKLAPWNWPIIDPNYHLIIIVNNNKYHTHTHTKHADNYYYMRNDELDWFQRVSLDWINRHWAKIIF